MFLEKQTSPSDILSAVSSHAKPLNTDSTTDATALNRRQFLAGATAMAGLHGFDSHLLAHAQDGSPPVAGHAQSIVVQVTSDHVVRGRIVHRQVLIEMLEAAMCRLAGRTSIRSSWETILRADDVVGIKFNQSAAEALGTSSPFATVLIQSLLEAGFDAQRLIILEAPGDVYHQFALQEPSRTWEPAPTSFGSGEDHFSSALASMTALINVPFLKTHNICGLTCCLKNLSHGLIKHPARYHGSHCDPYIADIVAAHPIASRFRLNLVNALRVVFDGGPEARDDGTWDAGVILASRDPVATDTLGLELINSQRLLLAMEPILAGSEVTRYLQSAEQRGLGKADKHAVTQLKSRI